MIEGVEDLALTTNGVLLAQHAAELKGERPAPRDRQPRLARPGRCSRRMSGGFGGLEQVLDGIDAALEAGPARRSRSTRSCGAASTTTPCSALLEHFRGTRVIVRLIEYMDVGNRNALASATRSCRRPSCCSGSRALAGRRRCAGSYRGEVAERYRYDGRRRRDRLHLLGQRAVLRRLHARAALLRGRASTPACSRRRAPTCAARCAPAPPTTELADLLRAAWSRPRGPLQRAARGAAPREQPLHKIEMHYIGG